MTLEEQIAAYLGDLWHTPVVIEDLSRIPGGASRQTYRFDAVIGEERRGLILRRDPVDSLIDTDRRIEYLAYQSFHPLGVPTPEPPGAGRRGRRTGTALLLDEPNRWRQGGQPLHRPALRAARAGHWRTVLHHPGPDRRRRSRRSAHQPSGPHADTGSCWSTELDHWNGSWTRTNCIPTPSAAPRSGACDATPRPPRKS